MKFVQLTLTDYNLVKDSGIHSLTIDFEEDVQLIIGSNGSGKTSILKQLSPIPQSRSLFGKQGFKRLLIEHDGQYYKLESEYEKPSSPHIFIEGDSDENLNVGRTTETQRELITEHLAITPFIDDLIMNRFVFPRWKATQRKEFLMAHNPDDIGFVLQLAKQQATKIRACKNNISRLQSRKIILEQELLSDEVVKELETERDQITQDLALFQQNLNAIDVGLQVLGGSQTPQVSDFNVDAVRKTLRSTHDAVRRLGHIERDDGMRHAIRDKLVGQVTSFDHRLETIDKDIATLCQELADLEIRYREMVVDGDLLEVEATIGRLESERDRHMVPKPAFELSREELTQRYNEWDDLRNILQVFDNRTIPLYSRARRALRERYLNAAKYRRSSYEMRQSDLRTQLDDLVRRHTISPSDIPNQPCAKNACPLYAHFMEGYESSEAKRHVVSHQLGLIERRLTRLDRYIEGMVTYFEASRRYQEKIEQIVGMAQSNPILHGVLRRMDILSVLASTPNLIALRLKEDYDHMDQWLKLKDTVSDLETAYELRSRCMGSQSHDTVKLVVQIESHKKRLHSLREEIESLGTQRTVLQKHIDDIQTFEGLKTNTLNLQKQYHAYMQILTESHQKDAFVFLRRTIEDIRNQKFLRMSEVERALRAQSGLQERYNEEVLSELTRIEKELSDLEHIEKALVAIPRENTIDFVNGIFKQANLFIEAVWTIPFKIELLDRNDGLNYEFMVSGDNQSLREMSECSEGQTEILSLAINLALRTQLEHLNLPLCLDEPARTMDDRHRQNVVILLRRLVEDGIISQLFIVSHHASMHEGFINTQTFVVRTDNVLLPEKYNEHASIT